AEGGPPPPPPPPNSPPVLEPARIAPPFAGATATSGAFSVGVDGITWTCKQCESPNSFDTEVCPVCGTSFADLLRPPAPERTTRDPNKVALISLFWPGAGHGYLGQWGQAVARSVVSLWVLLVTITAAAQDGIGAMSLVFGTIAFALWVVAAHDAYREASGDGGRVILKQGYFLWVVLGILVLMMALFLVQGLQVGAAAG
ncbi:MAG: hypothetical protein ACRDK3_14515, partial [Actinomycetota bacterium]